MDFGEVGFLHNFLYDALPTYSCEVINSAATTDSNGTISIHFTAKPYKRILYAFSRWGNYVTSIKYYVHLESDVLNKNATTMKAYIVDIINPSATRPVGLLIDYRVLIFKAS